MMKINKKNILNFAIKYDKKYKDTEYEKTEEEIKRLLKDQSYLTRKDLIKIGEWKSKRPKRHYNSNENNESFIKEITKFSFKAKSEKAKIKSLLTIKGVSWPVASTILHFAFPNKYPIMDFRVIWSLGWEKPSNYNYEFWDKYCKKINYISKRYRVPIRLTEKSLWQFSKENQR